MSETEYLWIAFTVAVLLDLWISATKSAFTHVRLPYLVSFRDQASGRVERTMRLMEKPGLRTALRLGLAFVHFMVATTFVMAIRASVPEVGYWVFALIVGVLLLLSVAEYLLERTILNKPEQSILKLTGPAAIIDFFFTPASRLMMVLLGEHAEKVTLSVTDQDLRDWVEVGQPESSLEKGEREMIYSIFHFGETMTKDVMVPRIDVLAMDINTTISEARQEFIRAGHSRVPVYDDTIDNVVGLLYAKDLLAVVDGNNTIASERKLLRQAYFVPEAKKVDELLAEMQSLGVHLALVVDEYGGVAGVVTLEDIVEEIVGEIRDEYDQSEEDLVQEVGPGEYVFLGRATIDEVNEITGLGLSTDQADTLGGYIYGLLGRVPQAGESVEKDDAEFVVEQVVARRILKVRTILHTHNGNEK